MKKALLSTLFFICALAVQAGAQQSRVAFRNSIDIAFVYIKAGTFLMGSPENEPGRDDDEPLHRVTISRDFFLAATEVTQEQFQAVMGYNPAAHKNLGKGYPVEQVSWDECMTFVTKLNQKEKTRKYRLPTEAEWEYACRAGTTTAFSSGRIEGKGCKLYPNLDAVAWYCGNSGHVLKQVAKKKPNPWGLFDMHGNVQEWCLDHSDGISIWSRRAGATTRTYVDGIVDPVSTTGEMRIFRSGSWNQGAQFSRAADRNFFRPTARRSYLGFRIVKEK